MALANSGTTGSSGGGSGTVTSVTAADTSIVVAGTAVAPTVATGTLDVIAADHPPAADWSNNSKKITSVANGTLAQDAAAFGQIPTALPPNGSASGDLAGSYPSPTVAAIHETSGPTKLTAGTIADGQYLKRTGATLVSGAPVASVAATDTSIVVAGTATAPTVATGTLDVIASQHAPAANWSNNSKKITALANGSAASDAAAFGQIPTALPPNGSAGGSLTGTYPNPTLSNTTVLRFAAAFPNLVSPVTNPNLVNSVSTRPNTSQARGCRVVIPITGTLANLTIFVGAQSGNIEVAIYDTGDASAGNYSRLYTTGAIACPAPGWQVVAASPALSVTAGQQVNILWVPDNATASVGVYSSASAGGILPAAFNVVPGGASPKLSFVTSGIATPMPSTIAEASVVSDTKFPILIATVS